MNLLRPNHLWVHGSTHICQ